MILLWLLCEGLEALWICAVCCVSGGGPGRQWQDMLEIFYEVLRKGLDMGKKSLAGGLREGAALVIFSLHLLCFCLFVCFYLYRKES
jgi:hypothetical protein